MFLAQNHPLCQGKAKPSLSQGRLGAVAAAAAVPPQECVEGAAAWWCRRPGPCVTPWLHSRR
ncbi:MAG: hypothetical protein ACPIOQ_58910, partial [Promethearchaeia archaeon]